MLIRKYLPNMNVKQKSVIYQRLKSKNYDLYIDGSISKTCDISNYSIPDIVNLISKIKSSTTIQIHTLKESRKKYLTIQKEITYNTKIGFNKILSSSDKILKNLFTIKRKEGLDYLNNIISDTHITDKTELIKGISETYIPVCNLSLIKTGDNQASTVLSVNNPARFTISNDFRELFKEMTSVITLIKPSEEHSNYLRRKTLENVSLLDGIKTNPEFNLEKRVHTINDSEKMALIASSSDIWYSDISYIISGKDIDELVDKTNETIRIAEKSNIILYWHTNSSNKQFASMFPGYGRYNEHLTETTREFVKRFTVNYLG